MPDNLRVVQCFQPSSASLLGIRLLECKAYATPQKPLHMPDTTAPAEPCRYISLLRLLRLGRAYRLFGWVTFLTYNQTVSLVVVTLVRNFMVG